MFANGRFDNRDHLQIYNAVSGSKNFFPKFV